MRFVLVLLFSALPAAAWEFTAKPICTLEHVETEVSVTLTYDHRTGLYAISVAHPAGWPGAPLYAIQFDGPRPLTISTDRHQVAGKTITVTDTGFSNVLNGLEFNHRATAFTATAAATFSLEGAAEPVQAFRDCTRPPSA